MNLRFRNTPKDFHTGFDSAWKSSQYFKKLINNIFLILIRSDFKRSYNSSRDKIQEMSSVY